MYGSTTHHAGPTDPVADVMTWPVATIDTESALELAVLELAEDEIGAVLVLSDDGRPVGMLSERDVVAHVAAGADLGHLSVGEVMSPELITVQVTESVADAARVMVETQVRHLPVLDGSRIAGLVSIRDLVAALLEPAPGV
jgi:CBS domain-containing protein